MGKENWRRRYRGLKEVRDGIDLHIHTKCSDGVLTPTQVVEKAYLKRLKTIAINDHDTVEGIEEALKATRYFGEIEVIAGAEFTTNYKPVAHILGLGIDINNKHLISHFKQLERKKLFFLTMAIKFLKAEGINISMKKVQEEMQTLTILNIKNFLLEQGLTIKGDARDNKLQEIIDEWVLATPSPQECIELIHVCGGKAVLAHPVHLHDDKSVLKNKIIDFCNWGIDGIEIIHPDHTDADRDIFKMWAKEMNLSCSGGSDFHGVNGRDDLASGDSKDRSFVPYRYWEELRGK